MAKYVLYERGEEELNSLIKRIESFVVVNDFDAIIAIPIMNGALQIAIEILKHFNKYESNIDQYFFPIKVSSYVENRKKGKADIKLDDFPVSVIAGIIEKYKKPLIMIIDDIVDTGETLRAVYERIVRLLFNYTSSFRCITVSLIVKANKTKFLPNFVSIVDYNDRWWVGFGMDDNGANRFTKKLYYIEKEE